MKQNSIQLSKIANKYLTVERAIGKWIDDKTVYERVFTFSNLEPITHGIDIDTLVEAECIIKSDREQWRNLPWLYGSGSGVDGSWHGGFFLNSQQKQISFQLGSNIANIVYGHIILRYTK